MKGRHVATAHPRLTTRAPAGRANQGSGPSKSKKAAAAAKAGPESASYDARGSGAGGDAVRADPPVAPRPGVVTRVQIARRRARRGLAYLGPATPRPPAPPAVIKLPWAGASMARHAAAAGGDRAVKVRLNTASRRDPIFRTVAPYESRDRGPSYDLDNST